MSYRVEDGWRKVSESGGSYVTAKLFNVNTGEDVTICVRDYDYSDGSRDDDYWYNMSVDDDARVAYCVKHGIIDKGVRAMVVKGRKIAHGYTGRVVKMRKIYDCYDRWVTTYAVFSDGKSTDVKNCVLVS